MCSEGYSWSVSLSFCQSICLSVCLSVTFSAINRKNLVKSIYIVTGLLLHQLHFKIDNSHKVLDSEVIAYTQGEQAKIMHMKST